MYIFLLLFLCVPTLATYCAETNTGACIDNGDCTCPGTIDVETWLILAAIVVFIAGLCICVACKANGKGRTPRHYDVQLGNDGI